MKILSAFLPKTNWKQLMSGLGIVALIVFSGLMIFETTKAEVAVIENGEKQKVKTHAETVKELLTEAEITYEKHDALSHDIDTAIEDGMNVTYEAADKVVVTIDGEDEAYHTTVDTVGELLKNKEINVTKHDDISHDKSQAINGDMAITVDKSFQVTLNNGGDKEKVRTTGGTVEEVLEANDISLDDSDKLKPGKGQNVKKDTSINITRVDTFTEEVEKPIDYSVEERKDDSLEKGKKNIIDEGSDGLLVKEYEVVEENGEEVSRELINEEVKQESEKRIVALGTKEKEKEQNLTTLSKENSNDDNSSNNDNGKTLQMNATAYTVDCLGCNGSGYTATGINLRENPKVVSVDPSVIPLGSKVWVEGYGTAVAGDTGGHIQGNRIDLHFESKSAALSFGRKTVDVKILD